METKHTPGPWIYAREFGPNITELPRITTIARCADFVIGLECDYPGGDYRNGDPSGDEEADARLIAAAPDLLEALKGMLALDEENHQRYPGDEDVCQEVQAARAAIARATGGTA